MFIIKNIEQKILTDVKILSSQLKEELLKEVDWTLIKEDRMEGIIGTLEFYAPVLVLGVVIIGIVYFMKKQNDKK